MADAAITATVPAARAAPAARGVLVPRLITGLALLLIWEVAVRLLAPAYVAKPTTVLMVAPHVLTDPVFLRATGNTLAAVAEGLAIALVFGTVLAC